MKKKYLAIGLMVMILAVILWKASEYIGKKQNPEIIKIGVMTPLTGDVASWGKMQRNATEMALSEVNSMGGIHSMEVEVIYEDDQANPKIGVNAFRKLSTVDKVPIVIGSPASGVTLAVASIANVNRTPLLSSGSTATAVGEAGPYVFRIMPSDDTQASIMAEWAKELGIENIAIVYVQNAWGKGLENAFIKEFEERGGRLILSEGVTQKNTDFRGILSKINSLKIDAIYAPLYTRGAGLMVRQAKELGIKKKILGADVYETPEFIEVAGESAEGVIFTRYGQIDSPEYQTFAKKYQDEYNSAPEAYAGYCYDAIRIGLHAIASCDKGEISGINVRKELLKIKKYNGVTGVSDFNGKNSASGKTFDRLVVKNGKNVLWIKDMGDKESNIVK